ncbi:hypothetical protein QYH69_14775 [Paraburkholderia sp. SARCC-3016]|uniref:hypothetical protein n=1 Tax=Paraburkholderia sp. SARCC-3016 TaxID=3058611 RepID=UPI0028077689|nr:hypothetical protein [Paraburkholderia sp. SARCC-3016]MDQ7978512.1 hypothetical protein [Paraburkholderia sp. SARCC-3016]
MKRLRSFGARFASRARGDTLFALRWRNPWHMWQGASWLASTLLAPPFTVIGILLLINARSDCPYFWPSAMAVVALTNALAIVDANQRHHRRPFGSRVRVALRYFGVSAFVGGALFMMLVWGTGILDDVAGVLLPDGHTARFAGSLAQLQWTLGATAVFCVLSFAHACALHAWLAFEVPIWYRISRGTFAPDRAERAEARAAADTGPPARCPPDSGSTTDTHRGGHS